MFSLKKIYELIAGTSLNDAHEIPVSEGTGPGLTKRYSIAQLKAFLWAYVQTQISGITKGDTGAQGATGAQGMPGEKGLKGDKGDKGDTGLKGDTGPSGAQGIQGPKGDKGDQGYQGVQGVQGIKGDTGDKGDQGEIGPPGTGLSIDENTPLAENEIEAEGLSLEPYTIYITSTGEIRYKLPSETPPVINNNSFNYTLGFTLQS